MSAQYVNLTNEQAQQWHVMPAAKPTSKPGRSFLAGLDLGQSRISRQEPQRPSLLTCFA